MIQTELHNYLATTTAITNIVSTRIYCDHIPQATPTLPAIVWNKTSTDHEHVTSGAAGYAVANFDIISLSRDLAEAGTLSEAVRTALQGYQGTWGSTDIGFVTLDQDWIDCTPNQDGSDFNSVYSVTHSYNIGYHETVPTFA